MSVDGTYEISISTPQGPQPLTLELQTSGAELRGQARQGEESMELSFDGKRV